MGQIRGFFQIRFSTFWLGEPKCTESDLKKIPGFVPFGVNLPHFWSKSGHPSSRLRGKEPLTGENRCLRWSQIWSDWTQIRLIWNFLRYVFRTFWLALILKSPDLSHFRPVGPNLRQSEIRAV